MNVLVIDVGGTNVKILATGQTEPRKFPSGRELTAQAMVEGVMDLAGDWAYEAVSIGYPGPVLRDRPMAEPHNLGRGWIEFDYAKAFARPVRIINDAAMQALGSYTGGKLLFLGLGTGLGTALVDSGFVEPMELAHLPYRKATYEDYVGLRGLERFGRKKWEKHVFEVVARMLTAFAPDEIVLGGGNVKKLRALPARCRPGSNANAFLGGFRLWEGEGKAAPKKSAPGKRKGATAPTKKRPAAAKPKPGAKPKPTARATPAKKKSAGAAARKRAR